MLDLSDFTVCAADSANLALTVRAFELSMERCRFGDAILFTHETINGPFRVVKIDKLTRASYQTFRLKQLPRLVETPFVLCIEWDGYVIDPRSWNPRFREYDYIGAKWPKHMFRQDSHLTVGNSGFSLHSKKFLNALLDTRFTYVENEPVDMLMCRTYRPALERHHGIHFAPEAIADLFSYESTLPSFPTFGFHGLSNMWRYMADTDLLTLVDLLSSYVFTRDQYVRLILSFGLQCKFHMVEQLYARMRIHAAREEALKAFRAILFQPHADNLFDLCEKLVQRQ